MKRLKYLFYTNIDNKVVYLQTLLNKYYFSDSDLFSEYGLKVIEIDQNNKDHLSQWCDIINDAYDDCCFNVDSAESFFKDHLFLKDTRTFVFLSNSLSNNDLKERGGG